ncbi:MAG: hypothetical protein Q7S11_01445 [bacterium]|nr:hypothetical protein [bacterium]
MKAMANNNQNKPNPPSDSLAVKSVRKNKKLSAQNKKQEPELDSFSSALLGTYSNKSDNTIEAVSDSEPILSSQDDTLDVISNDSFENIKEPSPEEKHLELPKEKDLVLLPSHGDVKILTPGEIQTGKKSLLPALILITLMVVSYAIGYNKNHTSNEENVITNNNLEEQTNPFEHIELKGKAAYVYDTTTGTTLFEYNAHDILPLASLTKLMTAITASEILPIGTVVTINRSDIESEGDSGLFMNERWKLSDIIGFTLMTSSNDGASALATVAGSLGQNAYGKPVDESKQKFIAEMNRKSQELGLQGTHFYNESGLDVDGEISGGYGTARDVALLMAYALKNSYRNMELTTRVRTTMTSLDNIRHKATNTNENINAIPAIIASKTGYTDLAGGNLAVAFDAGLSHPVIVVVLGSTREGRFKDAEALTWAALEELKRK